MVRNRANFNNISNKFILLTWSMIKSRKKLYKTFLFYRNNNNLI